MIRALALVAFVAGVAHANVWKDAIDTGSPDPQRSIYESEMKSGDELTQQAASQSVSPANARQLVNHAALSYRNAAAAKPNEPEPYFRLGRLLYSFYFECGETALYQVNRSPLCPVDSTVFDKKRAQEIIDAWDKFEQLAPLDPRLSCTHDESHSVDFNLLFHRAVLHTRLVTKEHLLAAIHDYELILQRSDDADETALANLAETYMMVGRLDDSIETYRQALRTSRNTETVYGLAVALDRDERGTQAKELMVGQGEQALNEFHKKVELDHSTFFVPRGEELYYFALAAEAFGQIDKSIDYWQKYILSGAHPEFQPRAHAHLDPMLVARKRKALHIEPPWHEIFH